MHASLWGWVAFNAFILVLLALDLGVFNRRAHKVGIREALGWSVFWISLALIFNAWIYANYGQKVGHEFLAGYLMEKSLSVDNIFVFILIFQYFKVSPHYQHRVLFWGILGALIFRGLMIGTGATLIKHFHFVIYVFGVFLIGTGIRMAFHDEEDVDPSKGWVYRWGAKHLRILPGDHGARFFIRGEDGKLMATQLFLVLLVIETTDIVFALDSIPAIFGVTDDAFIIYTSNVFAILGLRALYFLVAGIMGMFRYLKYGLSLVLIFIGVKMLLDGTRFEFSISIALAVIAGILGVSVLLSVFAARRDAKKAHGLRKHL